MFQLNNGGDISPTSHTCECGGEVRSGFIVFVLTKLRCDILWWVTHIIHTYGGQTTFGGATPETANSCEEGDVCVCMCGCV